MCNKKAVITAITLISIILPVVLLLVVAIKNSDKCCARQ